MIHIDDDEPSFEDSVGREMDLWYILKEEREQKEMNEHYEKIKQTGREQV